MINLSRVCNDPRISQEFVIKRKTGDWNEYGRFEETETEINAIGVVTTVKGATLEMIPESDRVSGMMVFISTTRMYQTHNEEGFRGTSDVIRWHGNDYRVMESRDDSSYGFYKAIAARM